MQDLKWGLVTRLFQAFKFKTRDSEETVSKLGKNRRDRNRNGLEPVL